MRISDIPQSGIYLQKGAITRLVVRMTDPNTGLPLQLQVADNLRISLLYPDYANVESFDAELYTDGSDGKIAYTTQNDGTDIDLSQVGLYSIQANASIAGIPLPPSSRSDFYVLPNVSDSQIVNRYTAFILRDEDNVRWAVELEFTGQPDGQPRFVSAIAPSGPTGAYEVSPLVFRDRAGIFWQLTINTEGRLFSNAVDSAESFTRVLYMTDEDQTIWPVTVDTSGHLSTS